MSGFGNHRIAFGIEIVNTIGIHNRKLAVFKNNYIASCIDKRDDIRSQVATIFANAQHDGRILASYHDFTRMIVVHYRQTVSSRKRVRHHANCLEQVAVIVFLHQMSNALSVGIGSERVTLRDQLFAQLSKILDDAIVDNRNFIGAVCMRMGITHHELPSEYGQCHTFLDTCHPGWLRQGQKPCPSA